jgi:hypothetical protein
MFPVSVQRSHYGFAKEGTSLCWLSFTMGLFVALPKLEVFSRVFLTTKNEVFYLRERDLVIEAGRISDQIACDPERIRKISQCGELLFPAEQKII